MTDATIVADVGFNSGDKEVDIAAAEFLKRFVPEDAEKPSDQQPEAKPQPPAKVKAEDETPPPEAEKEDGETEEEPEKQYAADDSYFKIKVGDEELEVTAKDLKRLYGQEVALTKRSQEVAEQRRKAEEETTKATASLAILLQRAQERAAPYKGIDFLKAARELQPEHLDQLRNEALKAFEEEKFLSSELQGFVQTIQQNNQQQLETKAEEAVKQLQDPASPFYLENWGDPLYDELRDFAVSSGLDQGIVDQLTDAPVFKLLHDAMQYRKGTKNVVVTKKVDKTPKKIIKGSASQPINPNGTPDKERALQSRLRQTGATDDAAELFMARWARNTPQD